MSEKETAGEDCFWCGEPLNGERLCEACGSTLQVK